MLHLILKHKTFLHISLAVIIAAVIIGWVYCDYNKTVIKEQMVGVLAPILTETLTSRTTTTITTPSVKHHKPKPAPPSTDPSMTTIKKALKKTVSVDVIAHEIYRINWIKAMFLPLFLYGGKKCLDLLFLWIEKKIHLEEPPIEHLGI